MYTIELTASVKKGLGKLEKKDVEIILRKIYELRDNPFHYVKRLEGVRLWRMRSGKFRVIMAIAGKKIIVVRVGLRKNVYDHS